MCRIGSRVNFDFFFPLSCARKKRVVNDGKCNQPMYRDIYTGTPCVRLIFHVRYTILTACVNRTKPELYISVQWDPRAHLWLWLSFDFISRFFFFFIKISMGLFVGQKNHFVVIKSCGLTCNRHIVWRHQIVLMFSRSRYLDGVFFLCDWISWIRLRRLGKPWKSCRRGKE